MKFEKDDKATASFIKPVLPKREEPQGFSVCWNETEKNTIDANGNILSDNAYLYHWDAENRLVRVNAVQPRPSTQADNITMEYDGLGRRVRILEKHGDTVLADKRCRYHEVTSMGVTLRSTIFLAVA